MGQILAKHKKVEITDHDRKVLRLKIVIGRLQKEKTRLEATYRHVSQ
jgi:hypothetical protein